MKKIAALMIMTLSSSLWAQPQASASGETSVTPMEQSLTAVSAAVPPVSSVPSNSDYMLQVLIGLGVVLALVFAMGWLVKRMGQGGLVGGQQMKVLASMPLGTRERILLIDVAGQQLLLGLAPGRISTLHTFDEPVVDTQQPPASSDFSLKLRELMGQTLTPDSQSKAPVGSKTSTSHSAKAL